MPKYIELDVQINPIDSLELGKMLDRLWNVIAYHASYLCIGHGAQIGNHLCTYNEHLY